MKLIDGLQSIKMVEDEFVFEEGDKGEEFYIIEDGEVDCLKKSKNSGRLLFVRKLK